MTLVELLVAVVILGLSVVAMVSGLLVMVSTSFLHREQSDLGTVLRGATEQLVAAPYVSCALPSSYAAVSGFQASVTPNDHSGTVSVTIASITAIDGTALCNSVSDPGLQLLTVVASYGGNKPAQTLSIVKSP